MAKFTIVDEADMAPAEAYPAPFASVHGTVSARRISPDAHSTWLIVADLGDGAAISWPGCHGDEGVYVVSGALDIDSRVCPADGCIIVESNVVTRAVALGATRVVHVGPYDPAPPTDGIYGPPSDRDHGVHVIGAGGWFASGSRERVVARWFADSTCATCRISFFHVARADALVRDLPHTHTQDEIIYVLEGSVIIGRHEYGPGHALCIPANVRYSVTTGPGGMAFVNYRRDVSTQAYGQAKAPELEGGLARGGTAVCDFITAS